MAGKDAKSAAARAFQQIGNAPCPNGRAATPVYPSRIVWRDSDGFRRILFILPEVKTNEIMSFQEAEATDADLNGVSAILRQSLEEASYTRNPDQIYANMDADPLISDLSAPDNPASRVLLLSEVKAHRADQMRDAAVSFCRAHQQEGPVFSDSANVSFGRVSRFRSLANALAGPDSSLGLSGAEYLLRDMIDNAAPPDRLEIQRLELAGKKLSLNQMWCYPAGDPENPFIEIGTSRSEAVNVLGLGCFSVDDELVRWAHKLSDDVTARVPIAWDAAYEACWRPGGWTYRLDIDDYGVLEVVHNPISGDNLIKSIDLLP